MPIPILSLPVWFVSALIAVECPSGNPRQPGDNGAALGVLQIHKIVVDDVNKFAPAGERFTYEDRANVEKSKRMLTIYLNHYARDLSFADKARIWNGGPK